MAEVHIVYVYVTPEKVEAFCRASLENAAKSIREPGIGRFDVIQQQDDPRRFVLYEVYTTPEAPHEHLQTEHYRKWRDTVADMMAEPRSNIKYNVVLPDE